jgi:hypothetical protein
MTFEAVTAWCEYVVKGWEWDPGGAYSSPVAVVRMGSALFLLTLSHHSPAGWVVSIGTNSPEARTPESLGPGSTLEAVVALLGAPTFETYECTLYAKFPAVPRLVLRFVGSDFVNTCGVPELDSVPKDLRVSWVYFARPSDSGAPN